MFIDTLDERAARTDRLAALIARKRRKGKRTESARRFLSIAFN